jgi:hypothetical protein
VLEVHGVASLRSLLTNNVETLWNMFGRFAEPNCDRDEPSDEQLGQINQRFIACVLDRARRWTN